MDGVADQVGEDLLDGGRVAPCRRQLAHDDLGLLVRNGVVQRIDDLAGRSPQDPPSATDTRPGRRATAAEAHR